MDNHKRADHRLTQPGRLRRFLSTWEEPESWIVSLGSVRFSVPLRIPVDQIREAAGCFHMMESPELREATDRKSQA